MLNTIQEDILKELMNIYVGKAASLLSEIVEEKINLSVPEIHLVHPLIEENLNAYIIPNFFQGTLMSSSIKFGDKFKGSAELVFPAEKVKLLVSLCIKEDLTLYDDESIDSFTDTDFDVIKEIGNVILNSVIGGLANLLNLKLEYTAPEIKFLDTLNYKKEILSNNDMYLLLLYVSFSVDNTEIKGAILSTFTLDSISYLLDKINTLKEDIYE